MEEQLKSAPQAEIEGVLTQLRRLERRDWWLWAAAFTVMLLLTSAVASFSLPGSLGPMDTFWQFHEHLAAYGLLGLVLLFVVYTFYQQFLLKQVRRRLAEQVVETARLDQARRRAEELLRLAEDRFFKAFHSSPDAMTISTLAEERYVEVNQAFLQMVGYDQREVEGRPTAQLNLWVNPGHRSSLLAALREKQKLEGAEVLFRTKAGHIRYGLLSAQVIQVNEESCLLSVIRDCTAQRMVEEGLRESELRFRDSERELRSLVDHAPYGIYRSSVEAGRFVSVNPALVRMLGYNSVEEVLALDLARDVYRNPEDSNQVIEFLHGEERFLGLELQWKRKDGSGLPVRASGRMVRTPEGKEFLEVIAEDISARHIMDY